MQHNFKVDEGECLIGRCDENAHCVLSVRGAARCALCAPRPGDWSAWRVCVRWHCHICPLPCSSTTRKPSLTVTCLWVCSHMTCRVLEVSIAIRLPLSGWQKMVAVLSEERGTRWRQKNWRGIEWESAVPTWWWWWCIVKLISTHNLVTCVLYCPDISPLFILSSGQILHTDVVYLHGLAKHKEAEKLRHLMFKHRYCNHSDDTEQFVGPIKIYE